MKDETLRSEKLIKNTIIPDYIHGGSKIVPGYAGGYVCRRDIVKDCLEKVPSYIVIREGRIMLLHILNKIEKVVIADGPVYYYRQREDSAIKTGKKSHEKNVEFWQEFLHVAKALCI